jgi:hypothetical protein
VSVKPLLAVLGALLLAASAVGLVVLARPGVAVLAASSPPAPVVPCDQVVPPVPNSGSGYRTVLDVVSVPPALQPHAVATNRPWPYFRKAVLNVRAGRTSVTVSVPKPWRTRAAISWGNGGYTGVGIVSSLRIAACPSLHGWRGYAGGFYLRSSSACVPLTFQVGRRSATVRFAIGYPCRS